MDNNETIAAENLESHLSDDYKLIDVREQDEWDAGHHSEAIHIPMGTIHQKIDDFKKNDNYIIICRSGARSGKVSSFMKNEGLNSFNLTGGMKELSLSSKKIVNLNGNNGIVI
jgi:rhodanese-related sulfurtransferase